MRGSRSRQCGAKRFVALVMSLAVAAGLLVFAAPAAQAGSLGCTVDKTTAKEGDTVTVTATHSDKKSMQVWVYGPGGENLTGNDVFTKVGQSTSLSATVTLDKGPGTYVAKCIAIAIGREGPIAIDVTVAAGPTPDAQVTCTASPATVFAGEAFTVTSAVTNASKFDSPTTTTVTAAGGSASASPLSVTAPWTTQPQTLAYTCTGTGTKGSDVKTASATVSVPVTPRALACTVSQPDPYKSELQVAWTWTGPPTDRVDVYKGGTQFTDNVARVSPPASSAVVPGLTVGTTYGFTVKGALINGTDPQITGTCSGTVQPAPAPIVTCTASPLSAFVGDTVTVTGTITNASSYKDSTVTVEQSGAAGGAQKSPLIVPASTVGTSTFTCRGTATTLAGDSRGPVTASAGVTVAQLPGSSAIAPTAGTTYGALSLSSDGKQALQAFTVPMPAAPAGWKYSWTGPGTAGGNLPAFAPCETTSTYTPTLIRDGATNATVVSGKPVDVKPKCVVPAPRITSATISGGALVVTYDWNGATPPAGMNLLATYSSTPSGKSGNDKKLSGGANVSGATVSVTAGVTPPRAFANVSLKATLGSTQSAASNAVTAGAEPPVITYGTVTGSAGTAIAPASPGSKLSATNTADAGYTYAWVGAAPVGLSIDRASGVISGTPTGGLTGSAQIKISNKNSLFPPATATVALDIAPAPPAPGSFTYPSVTGTQGTALTPVRPAVNQLPATRFFYAPDLCSKLPGLTIDPATGVISGTPGAPARDTVRVSVRDSGPGGCTALTGREVARTDVAIAITSSPITVAYPSTTLTVGTPAVITPTAPSPNTRAGLTYSVVPTTLPAGLAFDPNTGVISGTPTAPVFAVHYTVTATLASPGAPTATASGDVTITVAPAPGGATPTYPAVTGPATVPHTVAPSTTSGWTRFSLGANAPAGMTIDPATGAIAWTPAPPARSVTVQVFADNGSGAPVALAPFTWTVTPAPASASAAPVPPAGGQGAGAQTGGAGASSNSSGFTPCLAPAGEIYPDLHGSVASTLTMAPNLEGMPLDSTFSIISGALPLGLSLDTLAGVISGTPEKANNGYGPIQVAVTAPDGTRRVADFNIAIDDPHHGVNYPNRVIGSVGQPVVVTPFTVNEQGRTVYELVCGTLPAGLSLDRSTGVISGTPTALDERPVPLRIKVTDGYGSTESSAIIVVNPNTTPWLRYPEFAEIGTGSSTRIVPTATALGEVGRYEISGRLPKGLRFDTSTGIISGVAKVADGVVYEPTITVRDKAGNPLASTTASMSVIKPAVPMSVKARPATVKLKKGVATTVVFRVKHPSWVTLKETVKCAGGCTWRLNKRTGSLVVTPGKKATRVSVTVLGSPRGTTYTTTYAGHAWSRTWQVR